MMILILLMILMLFMMISILMAADESQRVRLLESRSATAKKSRGTKPLIFYFNLLWVFFPF